MAKHTIENHMTHYHAALPDAPKLELEILEKYKGRNGFFIKKYLIGAEYNMNEWRTPWDAIKKDVWGFEGKPIVLTPRLDHPRVSEQDNFAVGEIIEVGIDETMQIAWQVSQIFDKKAQQLIRDKKVRYGSPTVLKYSDATTVERKLGNGRIQTTLNRFIPAHDAIVEEPAYGKQVDFIKAICDGDGVGCSLKLMAVSASVQHNSQVEEIIKREHDLLDKKIPEDEVHEILLKEFGSEVNSDNVDQLTIVPFVKKVLKANFKAKTLKEMVEYSKKTRQGSSSESCVSRKISILADEHPKWDHDQIIAVAYSYCRKDAEKSIQKMILGDLTPEIMGIQKSMQEEKELVNELSNMTQHMTKLKA